jgi:hypothetical protein
LRTGRPRSSKRANPVQEIRIPQLKELAHKSLHPIKRKLMGLQSAKHEKGDKEITTANQVERLIKEAMSPSNLVSVICAHFIGRRLMRLVGTGLYVCGLGGMDVTLSIAQSFLVSPSPNALTIQ